MDARLTVLTFGGRDLDASRRLPVAFDPGLVVDVDVDVAVRFVEAP